MAGALFACLMAACVPQQAQAMPVAYDSLHTQVLLLGTGTPNAEPERSGPATAILVRGHAYLVDAGPGVVRRAAAARHAGVTAVRMENLRIVFLTHLHSDHTVGLPDLMLTPWVLDRTAPLEVYGPAGTGDMVRHLLAAYAADIANRRGGLQPHNETGWQVHAHEVHAGEVYRDSLVRVTAFAVPHDGWQEALGYRFDAADRSVVVSGDTRASEAVVRACAGCDVLVHEVYSSEGFARLPANWQRYHVDAHTSAVELGQLAARARPGLLILTHVLPWGSSPAEIVREVGASFPGPVAFGRDLELY
jgi:ribonuclease BN (tRNA processing enzyme)